MMNYLIVSLILFSLNPSNNGAFAFTGKGINSVPSVVQTKLASIEFYGVPEIALPANGLIKLTAPEEIFVHTSSTHECRDILNALPCTVEMDGDRTFVVTTPKDLVPNQQFQFSITNAITNPTSIRPSASFTMLTSSGESETADILLEATPGLIPSENFVLTPSSQVVGAANDLTVYAKVTHTVPKGGFFFIDFPRWNAQNTIVSQQKTYIQGNEICTPIKTLSGEMTCDFQNDRLTIYGGASADIEAGSEIELKITGFRNPIDTSVIEGFKVSTQIMAQNQYWTIDEGKGTIQVKEYAQLSQATLEVRTPQGASLEEQELAGVVQEMNHMELKFYLPVPLNPGCLVSVQLPQQYSISTVTKVGTLQVFGFYKQYTVEEQNLLIDTEENMFTIMACQDYRENDKIGVIYISQLRQPPFEKETDSVIITINAADGGGVAKVDKLVTFTPIRGEIEASGEATNKVVQSKTNIEFQLKPQHKILAEYEPQLIIEFPPDVQITSPSCDLVNIGLQKGETRKLLQGATCVRQVQQFIVKTELADDYDPVNTNSTEDMYIFLTIGQVTNPISTYQVAGLRITIASKGLYAIDEYEGPIVWTLTEGSFASTQVVPQFMVAFRAQNLYTFTFTPAHTIPQNGYVEVWFPNEVFVADKSYSQSSCAAQPGSGFPTRQIICEFITSDDKSSLVNDYSATHYGLRILNAFRRDEGKAGTTYTFTVPGVRNPIQITETPGFVFATFTRQGYSIDNEVGASVQMQEAAEIKQAQVTLSSYVNAKPVDYHFVLVPSVPLKANSYIMFTFPKEMILPADSRKLNCQNTFKQIVDSISCDYDPDYPVANSVRVRMTLANGLKQIEALDRFDVKFSAIKNPISTKKTDSIEVQIVSGTTNEPINIKMSGITVTTNTAFPVANANVLQSHNMPGVEVEFTLKMIPVHEIQVGGGILISYPPQVTPSLDDAITVQVSVTGNEPDQDKIYVMPDKSARAIFISNVIQDQALIPDKVTELTVVINGLRNPFTNDTSDSFEIQTFDFDDGQYTYFIDKADKTLTLDSKCSYPCADCDESTPDICTKCFPLSVTGGDGLPLLQLGKCVAECATSRYYDTTQEQCLACDTSCLTCNGPGKDECTSCGIDEKLYLYKGQCLATCPDRFIGDSNENKCIQCTDSCLTCSNMPNSCDSCDLSGKRPFLYKKQCLDKCPPKVSVLQDSQCLPCDGSCATCEGSPFTCTSCASYMLFDPVNKKCSKQCQFETQIYNEDTRQCDSCAQHCTKCAGDINTCTECEDGFVLNTDSTCKLTCNAENQTPVDGICKECEKPCATCTGQPDHCSSCLYDFKLYLTQECVQYCPPKYTLVQPEEKVCAYEGLICPPGFKNNTAGDGCVPIKFECKTGYEINDARTACVPMPGSPVPFPFLLGAIFMSFLVLGSHLKEKFFTRVTTSLIFLIGSFEVVMYGLMVGFAWVQNEWIIMFLSAVGLISLIITNITFTFYYNRDVVHKDAVFEKWLHFFPRSKIILPPACLLLNFKCSKMLYSGFYGLESCMAKFGKNMVFYRVMKMCTYFNWVFAYGAIYVADVFIFFKISWGYQLLILGYETAILQTIIILLTWYELKTPAQELLGAGKGQYTSFKTKQGKELRVKSAFDGDDSDYEEGVPDVNEDTLIRTREVHEQKEINLRKVALNQLLKQVSTNQGGVDIGAGLENCLSKFDPKYLKYRRAFSMSGRANFAKNEDWLTDENDSAQQNSDEDYMDPDFAVMFDYQRERRNSWPVIPKDSIPVEENFKLKLDEIKGAAEEYLFDNCYTDVKRVDKRKEQTKPKTISRRTQTYLRELLQLEGEEGQESDMEVLMDEDAEVDETYTKNLINNVIKNMDDNDHVEKVVTEVAMPVHHEKEKQSEPVKEQVPDFVLADIMGDFEIDDLGNFIIIRGPNGITDLYDKQGRKVNRRGYLSDRFGNVINFRGDIVFKAVELDADDEIPAPFGFEKRKKTLIRLADQQEIKVPEPELPPVRAEKEASEHDQQEEVAEPSEHPVNIMQVQPTRPERNDVDDLIDQVTKEKQPKKQHQANLKTGFNNMPPKRYKGEDSGKLFQMIGIENSEQRRLAKIAVSISGVANQLQMQQQQSSLKDFVQDHQFIDNDPNSIDHEQLQPGVNNSMQGDLMGQMLMRRPVSGERGARPATTGQGTRFGKGQSTLGKPAKSGHSLHKIYGNIDDLVGLEEAQINQLQAQKTENQTIGEDNYHLRGKSRGTGPNRIEGLESLYMNKKGLQSAGQAVAQSQGAMNGRRTSEGMRPVRPTMIQYLCDNPAEASAHTKMEGTMFMADGANRQFRTGGSPVRDSSPGQNGGISPNRGQNLGPVMSGNFVNQNYQYQYQQPDQNQFGGEHSEGNWQEQQ